MAALTPAAAVEEAVAITPVAAVVAVVAAAPRTPAAEAVVAAVVEAAEATNNNLNGSFKGRGRIDCRAFCYAPDTTLATRS